MLGYEYELVFNNDVKFSFYLSFKSVTHFETIFGENLRMIAHLQQISPSPVVGQFLVRISPSG